MRRKPVADWTMDELKDILKRVRQALGERDYAVMHSVVETLDYLTHLAKDKQAAEIYRILVSSKSEKTRDVLRVLDLEREAERSCGSGRKIGGGDVSGERAQASRRAGCGSNETRRCRTIAPGDAQSNGGRQAE